MKFGELTALLGPADRFVKVCFEDGSGYSAVDTKGRLGILLNDFEIAEISRSGKDEVLLLRVRRAS